MLLVVIADYYCDLNEWLNVSKLVLYIYRLIMDVPEASHSQDALPDAANSSSDSSVSLTPHMLAKIERNRQRALMLRQARLANRPSSAPEGSSFVNTYMNLDKFHFITHFISFPQELHVLKLQKL